MNYFTYCILSLYLLTPKVLWCVICFNQGLCYVCPIIGDFSSLSDVMMSFDTNVTDIQDNNATLMFTPSSAHCYVLFCIIRHVNSGNTIVLDISGNPVVIPELAASTTYEVVCNATRQAETLSSSRTFKTG